MVLEMLTELSFESVFTLWLVPSRMTSNLDGFRASHKCRSQTDNTVCEGF